MKKGYGCPDGASSQRVVLERKTEEFTVQGERHQALFHVQVNAQDTLLLERLAVLTAFSVTPMAQLAEPIETETEVVVAKGVAD